MSSAPWTRRRAGEPVRAPRSGTGIGTGSVLLGAVGAVLMAVSSWWVGAVPHAWQHSPPAALGWFPIGNVGPRIGFYVGLALMTAAWLLIGRATDTYSVRRLRVTACCWAAPMLVSMPLASRDLWAYAAQGDIVARGLDPYRYAPVDVPGVFADNVSSGWLSSPAPYGPFWLGIDHGLAALYGEHVVRAVMLLRSPALAGFLLLLWTVPRLAVGAGWAPGRALWLVVVNPFTIELVLGAGHNDLLLAGLMTAGATLALRPGPALITVVPAAALMALAAGVKSPAAIGVAFVVPLTLSRDTDRGGAPLAKVVVTTAVTALSAAVTFAVATVVTGFGLGWVHQVGSSAVLVNWLSLPTDAAMLSDVLTGHVHGASRVDAPMQTWRTAGLVLAGVLVLALWVVSVRAALAPPDRAEPSTPATCSGRVLTLLGAAMLTVTLLGPAVQLWYLLWALPFLAAATAHRRATTALVAVQIAMVFTVDPHGLSVTMKPQVIAIIAAAVVVAGRTLGAVPLSAPAHDDADRTRTRVHADGGRHR